MDKHGFNSVEEFIGHSLQYITTHHHLVELQTARKAKKAADLSNKDTSWGKGSVQDQTASLTSNE
jgi:hypothetical protein